MYVKIKKRNLVLAAVLGGLLILGLCAAVLFLDRGQKARRADYEAQVAAGWRQSVAELSEALSDLETDLKKGRYASGDYQAVSWAARVFAEAGAARTALESLPVYDLRLQNTETFLNQVGEFTLEMARKQLRGEGLKEDEEQSLETLALRSRQLADEVLSLSEKIADENPDFATMQEMLLPSGEGEEKTDFESLEDIFSGDKPLVYDGDYSAWHTDRGSSKLSSVPPVDAPTLPLRAADILGVADEELKKQGSYDKPFPFTEWEAGDKSIALTHNGGRVYGFSRPREVSEAKLTLSDAIAKGGKALGDLGYPNMEAIAWQRNENTITVTYGGRQNGVLIYADRITATLALDNGEILGMNAVEYLLSHDPERSAATSRTAEEGATVLREDLTVLHTDLVSLPCGDGTEKLCWQYTVTDGSEEKVLVFVNAHTKVEEDILILTENEDFRKVL